MENSICFKCGARKIDALSKCYSCASTPKTETEFVISIALSELVMSVAQLEIFSQDIGSGRKSSLNEVFYKKARNILNERRLLATPSGIQSNASSSDIDFHSALKEVLSIPEPSVSQLVDENQLVPQRDDLNDSSRKNSLEVLDIALRDKSQPVAEPIQQNAQLSDEISQHRNQDGVASEVKGRDALYKEGNWWIGTRTKIWAYIANFFIVGAGFVVIDGWKGMPKAFAWLVVYGISQIVSAVIWPKDVAIIVLPLLVLISSYIHLQKTIKNRPIEHHKYLINFISTLLKLQSKLFCRDHQSMPIKAKTNWSVGYVAGFSDAALQIHGIANDAQGVAIMAVIFIGVYGGDGLSLFKKLSDQQKMNDKNINHGMKKGGEEFMAFIRGNEKIPLGWSEYVNGD